MATQAIISASPNPPRKHFPCCSSTNFQNIASRQRSIRCTVLSSSTRSGVASMHNLRKSSAILREEFLELLIADLPLLRNRLSFPPELRQAKDSMQPGFPERQNQLTERILAVATSAYLANRQVPLERVYGRNQERGKREHLERVPDAVALCQIQLLWSFCFHGGGMDMEQKGFWHIACFPSP